MDRTMDANVALARSTSCPAWSALGPKVLGDDGARFDDLLRFAAEALTAFHTASGLSASVWVVGLRWRDRRDEPTVLVTVFLATDEPATAADLTIFGEAMGADPRWASLGVQERPSEAFCALHAERGRVYRVWDRLFGEHVAYGLADFGARVVPIRWKKLTDDELPEDLGNAEGHIPDDPSADSRKRDQLKMAFALHFVQRIIEADGLVDEAELAFKRRLFPARIIEENWLDDPEMLRRMATQAEQELKKLLGDHEKLALLATLYASCYSDGKVDVREVKVLREAADALGISRSAVLDFLASAW